MKIEVNENRIIVLKEIFTPIELITNDNERLIICMRDSGFEIFYGGQFYELKQSEVKTL